MKCLAGRMAVDFTEIDKTTSMVAMSRVADIYMDQTGGSEISGDEKKYVVDTWRTGGLFLRLRRKGATWGPEGCIIRPWLEQA